MVRQAHHKFYWCGFAQNTRCFAFLPLALPKTRLFTVHVRTNDFCEAHSQITQYATNANGYDEFLDRIRVFKQADNDIQVAIESTGNARFFKNRIEREGDECCCNKHFEIQSYK